MNRPTGNMMRFPLVFAAVFMLALPACAQTEMPAEAAAEVSANVTIMGHEFPAPAQIDQPMTWEQVKDYLPEELTAAPEKKPAYEELEQKVSELLARALEEYEAGIDSLVPGRMKEKGEDEETARLFLGDYFIVGNGDEISKDVQNKAKRYMALSYIKSVVEETLGAPPKN